MGKNLTEKGRIVFRDEKVAFMGLEGVSNSFTRMEAFTSLNPSKESETEDRKYVDERSKRTLNLSMSSSIAFEFDEYKGVPVLEDLVSIIELEKVGNDANRSIVIVDLTEKVGEGYKAIKRDYTVVPEGSGDHEYIYTHSGTFNSAGSIILGVATLTDDGDTCTFVEGNGTIGE